MRTFLLLGQTLQPRSGAWPHCILPCFDPGLVWTGSFQAAPGERKFLFCHCVIAKGSVSLVAIALATNAELWKFLVSLDTWEPFLRALMTWGSKEQK